MKKTHVINKLLDEGWFTDINEARTWIMLRRVLADDRLVYSTHDLVPYNGIIRIKDYYKRKYVSKGGLKLEKAIADFSLNVKDKVALDCGASTGGFTDCLLCHGAKMVYAVDAGHNQLAGKLQIDERVINYENTNLSDEKLKSLMPQPELITLDLSYLSLKKAIGICSGILMPNGMIICLVKPIYEVSSSEIRRNGQINDISLIRGVLLDLCRNFTHDGWRIIGVTNSPVRGNKDTLEFFIGLTKCKASMSLSTEQYADCIEKSLISADSLNKFNRKHIES